MTEERSSRKQAGGGINWTALISIGIFIVVIAAGLYLVIDMRNEAFQARQQRVMRQQHNKEMGLPLDYPREVLPVYAGVEITASDRGTATASSGEPMDMWHVHGQIDEDKEPIFEFYNQRLIDMGMRQTQFVGLPTGYGIDYGDEQYAISIVIEKTQVDDLMQVDLKIHRIRED